jgi:hypothetical protein
MNNDNSDIDNILNDFDFKPITDGLGFHHSLQEKKNIETNMKSQQAGLKKDMTQRVKTLQNEARHIEKPLHMGELSAFYESETPSHITELTVEDSRDESANTQASIMAPIHYRFVAWLIDVVILFTVMFFTVAVIVLSTELPLETFNIFMLSDELFLSFGSIFGMFYLFYFTLLDMTKFSTIGKRIMSIRLESNSSRINLVQSFTKAVVSLVAIPTMGLPALLRIDNMLTSTYVSNR